jgi:enamine deaminase RidA (YjgF/YER057c/UK114 family)
MSEIKRIDVKKRYSEIVIHNNTVYLSGQVPWEFEDYDIDIQTANVFKLVEDQLIKAGSDKNKLLSLRIYLRNPEDYDLMNEVFEKWIPDGCAPTRATICNVKFPNPKWQIEVVAIAAL